MLQGAVSRRGVRIGGIGGGEVGSSFAGELTWMTERPARAVPVAWATASSGSPWRLRKDGTSQQALYTAQGQFLGYFRSGW